MDARFKKIAHNVTGIEFLIDSNEGFYKYHTECIDYDVFKLLCDLIDYLEDKWYLIKLSKSELNIEDVANREIYNFISSIKEQMESCNNYTDSFSINDCIIIYHDTVTNISVLVDKDLNKNNDNIVAKIKELKKLKKIKNLM